MIIENEIENFLRNCSFFWLFFCFLFYWLQAAFFPKSQWKFLGSLSMSLSSLSLFFLLVWRWKESGHFPLSNLYECLTFLSFSFAAFGILLEYLTKNHFLGCITAPIALFTSAFANFSLPAEMQQSSPLVPALQSNWLMMHVTIMILSYAFLMIGCLLSIAFLVLNGWERWKEGQVSISSRDKSVTDWETVKAGNFANGNWVDKEVQKNFSYSSFSDREINRLLKIKENLDNLSYRVLGLGFPFLTIGILSGAVWANEAWGSYWSWDPKETWALLTWLVFAIYLHTRLNKGWQGTKPALIASFGFLAVWVCFLGVNLMGEGLHSYGWFS